MSMPVSAPAVKKTAIATLNSSLATSMERLNNAEAAIGLSEEGVFVPFTGTNYVNNAISIKHSVVILDGSIHNIADTYATKTYVDDKFTALIGDAPSALDTLGEIADALNDDPIAKTTLSNQITAETSRATAAEATLTASLAAEVTRAEAAEEELAADLSAEVTRAQAAELVLTNNLASEVTRSTTQDTSQNAAITKEIADRTAAVTALNTSLTNLITEKYTELNTAISTETARATAEENRIEDALDAEILRATNAESALTTSLANEVTRAEAAELVLTNDLAAEVSRATAAEVALDGRLDIVEATYIKKDGSVAFTGALDMGNNKITSLASPVSNQDGATKAYVDSKITNLGSVFEYVGLIAAGQDLDALNATHAGSYYRVTSKGTVTYGAGANSISVNIGDGVVKNTVGGWDLVDNTDAVVEGTSGRITVSGNANDGYVLDIASNYVGQASINTVGTVTTGTWEASVVDVPYGGTNIASYSKGDLLLGNASGKVSKLPIGASNTILRSDGADASWVVADSEHVSLTSTTNFAGLSNLQQSLDFLYNNTQIRKFAQHEIVSSSALTAADAASPGGKFQAGKVIFVNYVESSPEIFLPKSDTGVINGSVFRIVHNGSYANGNLTISYYDANNVKQTILELAPKDSISCVWNASEGMYLFAVGI